MPRKRKQVDDAAAVAPVEGGTVDKLLAETLAALKKKYKGDVLTTIAAGESFVASGISTGFRELDDILTGATDAKGKTVKDSGVGMPRGRIMEIFGKEASGKTTLVLMMIKAVQAAGGRCALVDAEHSLDPRYAANIGVDMTKLYISQPDSAEQALDITNDLVKSGAFDFIAIDSIAALAPQDELDADMEKASVAIQARLISKAMRKLCARVQKKNVILACVNQVRMKIGVMFGSPYAATGGSALKYYASIRLEVTKTKTHKKGEKKVGIRSQIYAIKNKAAPPFRVVFADIYHNKGIVDLHEDPDFGGGD